MDFAPGDVVALKSGGPSMTVERVDGETVRCAWRVVVRNAARTERDAFSAVMLHKPERRPMTRVAVFSRG